MTRRPTAVRLSAGLAALTLLGGLVACSDDSSSTPDAGPAPATSSAGSSGSETPQPEETESATDDAEVDAALQPAVDDPAEDSVYPDVGDPSVDALHYDLELVWAPAVRSLTGTEQLTFRSTADADFVQLDLAAQLEVESVDLDGERAEFEHSGKDLVVSGDFVEGGQHLLTVEYSGEPEPVPAPTTRQDFSTTGFTVTDRGEAWTMQEPYGAYSWYAVNDHPSDEAFYDFTLRVPADYTGVANGVRTQHRVKKGIDISRWHLDSVAPSYLVTVAFGPYEVTEDESTSGVPITYWVAGSTDPKYLANLRYTPEALAWVESKLGPYPFSSLGILLVPSQSGMETQTMITLGITDYATSPAVLVHEIVHQWYGDQVTPSDWSDLWMNEGMAMYLQFAWQADDTGTPIESILRQAAESERESRRVNGPPGDYDADTFGEIQVYYGPALMWHQVRERVGDDAFWAMVRAWPSVDPDGNSNRAEYLAWVEEETGEELSDLFDGWLLAKQSPKFG